MGRNATGHTEAAVKYINNDSGQMWNFTQRTELDVALD